MSKNKIATKSLLKHINDNPLTEQDGYCLNDEFVENCLYAANSLQAAYIGSLRHMDGMVDSYPLIKEHPLLVPMSHWLEVIDQWGEAERNLTAIGEIMPSSTWVLIKEFETNLGYPILTLKNSTIKETLKHESDYLYELVVMNKKNQLATGIMRKVINSICENKLDAPLIQWCYYLNMTSGSLRAFVDHVLPAPENYINIKEIYEILDAL